MPRATGTFEVKMTPQAPSEVESAAGVGRFGLEKVFSGDLVGTSRGTMLAVQTDVPGSAGYVAIERVEGELGGRAGGFVLQHDGRMSRGVGQLTVTVVPDSGTGGLAGLSGTLQIRIEGGEHFYDLEYLVAATF